MKTNFVFYELDIRPTHLSMHHGYYAHNSNKNDNA